MSQPQVGVVSESTRPRITKPLALLNYLDALEDWNSHLEEKISEPEGTADIRANAQVVARVGRSLKVPEWFAFECLGGCPVKELRGVRKWVLDQKSKEDYDPIRMLYRYAKKHDHEVDVESYWEARREALD